MAGNYPRASDEAESERGAGHRYDANRKTLGFAIRRFSVKIARAYQQWFTPDCSVLFHGM